MCSGRTPLFVFRRGPISLQRELAGYAPALFTTKHNPLVEAVNICTCISYVIHLLKSFSALINLSLILGSLTVCTSDLRQHH